MNNLMIGLDVLDTTSGKAFLSLGAVFFDPDNDTLGENFYGVIDSKSCADAGLPLSDQTSVWWPARSTDDHKVLDHALSMFAEPLHDVLSTFGHWVKEHAADNLQVWSSSSDFARGFLAVAHRKVELKAPWSLRADRCLRTLESLPFLQGTKLPALVSNPPDVLDHVMYQARCASVLLRRTLDMGFVMGFIEEAAKDGGVVWIDKTDPQKHQSPSSWVRPVERPDPKPDEPVFSGKLY